MIVARNAPRFLVFVYGTLKQNERLFPLYLEDAEFMGKTQTLPEFQLWDNGHFPYMTKAQEGEGYAVHGEIYYVTQAAMDELDRLEGVPNWYNRELIQVVGHTAFAYVYKGDTAGCVEIKDGEWTGHRSKGVSA